MDLNEKVILITGGTGSFGRAFTAYVEKKYKPQKLIIYSRDEEKQYLMQERFDKEFMSYVIGDIRDKERLDWALSGVDYVIHSAALKQNKIVESNPFEAIETNVIGTRNLLKAALDQKVEKVIYLSNNKAVNPINLYGSFKLLGERLFISSNYFTKSGIPTSFSVVRYPTLFGSPGSIIRQFLEEKEKGILTIADFRMTGFCFRLNESIRFLINVLGKMKGGEIFVPKTASIRITDLARAVCPKCKQEISGVKPGDRLHELLISKEESLYTAEFENYYIIYPGFCTWVDEDFFKFGVKRVPTGFEYTSDVNSDWLSIRELEEML